MIATRSTKRKSPVRKRPGIKAKRVSQKDRELVELRKQVSLLNRELDFFKLTKPKPFGWIAVDIEGGHPSEDISGIYSTKLECQRAISSEFYHAVYDEDNEEEIRPRAFPVFLTQADKDHLKKLQASTGLRPASSDDFTYPADDPNSPHYDNGDEPYDDRDNDGNSLDD